MRQVGRARLFECFACDGTYSLSPAANRQEYTMELELLKRPPVKSGDDAQGRGAVVRTAHGDVGLVDGGSLRFPVAKIKPR